MSTTVEPEQGRRSAIPDVLGVGFRLFFLAAGLFAVASIAAWLVWLGVHDAGAAIAKPTIAVAPHLWHGHEMIFGFVAAVVAGFVLTAVPSWTGAPPAGPVFVLVAGGLWLLGRLAIWFSAYLDPILVAVIDLAFLPALATRIAIDLFKSGKPANLVFLLMLGFFLWANLLLHLEWIGMTTDTAGTGLRLGILTAAGLIAIVGGRVTPAFTRNALVRRGLDERSVVRRAWADRLGVVLAIVLVPAVGLGLGAPVLAALAGGAALANGIRLAGWGGRLAIGEPILWSLHLGFAMLVAGYGLLAIAYAGDWLTESAAVHVLAIGAVGGMAVAMMTRAALGHTGRPLVVRPAIAAAYVLVAVAALARVLAPAFGFAAYTPLIVASGLLWTTAFLCFLWVYVPILVRSRALPTAAD